MPTGDGHGVAPAHGSATVVEDFSPLSDMPELLSSSSLAPRSG